MPGAASTFSAVIVVPSLIVATKSPSVAVSDVDQDLLDVELLLLGEPVGVVEEDRDRDRVVVVRGRARASSK